jgi:hypothetical protein
MSSNKSAPHMARSIEERIADWVGGFGPWLAPVPSAALVFWAMQQHFVWATPAVALAAAAVIEVLGFSAINTALMLHDWNGRRPRGEHPAPFGWSAFIVGVYLISVIILTVALDFDSQLTRIAPALFPVTALVGSMNIALRTQHKQRLERLAESDRQAQAAADQAEQDRKQREAEAKAEELRREMDAKAEAERIRLEEKAEREARRQERAARQTTRQSATPVATDVAIDRDTFVRLFTTDDYSAVEDLAHSLGFNGELKAYYAGGRRSVSRLSQLVGVNPRTGQRWIDASVAQNVAPNDATNNQAL